MSEANAMARGKWHGILGQWLNERTLSGKHGPCPICNGKDRFRLDDKDGCGTWICSHCGAGDGYSLLMQINGWDFKEAAAHVKQICGNINVSEPKAAVSTDKARAMLSEVWGGAIPVKEGDPVHLYLTARVSKCDPLSLAVRHHPALPYYHDDGKVTTHPAMLARVIDSMGKPISIHRTYLTTEGKKAAVESPKKLMTGTAPMSNCAIRLAQPKDGWLGVAEGIETAMAASKLNGDVPVWSCVSAGILEKFRPPEGVTDLFIFGDNDRSFTGQSAAYNLARAVTLLGVECHVIIPPMVGTDWADDQTPHAAPPPFEIPPGWPNTARIVPGSRKSR